jgi:hypothetical protein
LTLGLRSINFGHKNKKARALLRSGLAIHTCQLSWQPIPFEGINNNKRHNTAKKDFRNQNRLLHRGVTLITVVRSVKRISMFFAKLARIRRITRSKSTKIIPHIMDAERKIWTSCRNFRTPDSTLLAAVIGGDAFATEACHRLSVIRGRAWMLCTITLRLNLRAPGAERRAGWVQGPRQNSGDR